MLRLVLPLCLTAVLGACQASAPEPATRAQTSLQTGADAGRPASIPDNACWTHARIPAVTETVLVPVGTQGETAPRQREIQPATDRLFAVVCPEQATPDFIASLQRALTVRGHYAGAISGEWGPVTAEAVRGYQASQGLDSNILSLEAAQRLGLVVMPRAAL